MNHGFDVMQLLDGAYVRWHGFSAQNCVDFLLHFMLNIRVFGYQLDQPE
jgi:hypothetical protein